MSVATESAVMEPTTTPSRPFSDPEVVELTLLVPRWQAQLLEVAAERRGMTTGQMLRKVINDLFGDHSQGRR